MVRRSGGKIGGYVRVGGHGMRRSRVFYRFYKQILNTPGFNLNKQ